MKVTMGDDATRANQVRGLGRSSMGAAQVRGLLVGVVFGACGGDTAGDTQAGDTRVADGAGEVDAPDTDVADVADAADDGAQVDVEVGGELAYSPCATDVRVGVFKVMLAEGYTAVEGRVANGVVPSAVRDETARVGECRLVEGRTLFCDPACGSGKACDVGGVCIDYPTAQSVGEVTVNGLTVPLTMQPTSTGKYMNGATTIPHPGFGEGDVITLVAAGDVLPGFSLAGRGVAPLIVGQSEAALVRGQALAIDWTPGDDPSARLRIVLDLAHHGGIAASVECEAVADDGRFEIAASLVDALIDIGVAGFPTLTLTRRTADSTTITPGCVELSVEHEVVVPVVVPGVTSCSSDEDCPDGETCQFDLTCG